MLLLGLGFMLALLCMAALMFIFSLLRWLFTGRKPQLVLVMESYKNGSKARHGRSGHPLATTSSTCLVAILSPIKRACRRRIKKIEA